MSNREENQVCPKCGFYLTDGKYCVKCGYSKEIFLHDMSVYDMEESDMELFLKDKFTRYVYNKNNFLVFILGPLFFSYSGFYWLGMLLTFFLFRIDFLVLYNYGLTIFLLFFFFMRFVYVCFFNSVVIWLIKLKIYMIKRKFKNYKEIIKKIRPTSILYVILALIMAICLSIIIYL